MKMTATSVGKLSLQERFELAKKTNISQDILKALSEDEDKMVRWCVATNINTPIDTLVALAKTNVRHGVAMNLQTVQVMLTAVIFVGKSSPTSTSCRCSPNG